MPIEMIEQLRSIEPRGEGVAQIDLLLAEVSEAGDARAIPLLLPFLARDDWPDELKFSLVHAIEAFDDRAYADGILAGLPALQAASPRWATIIHMRILNSPAALAAYDQALGAAPAASREAAAKVLSDLCARRPAFCDQCERLLRRVRD